MLETMFIAAQAIAFIGWLALFASPWLGRRRAVRAARWVAAALCLLYLAYFLPNLAAIPRDQGYTLAAVGASFDTPALLLAGWIHYLVLDLWVGSWEAEHGGQAGVSHALLLLCLFATMMVGPLGLLLYLVVAALRRKAPLPAGEGDGTA
jgi:hypothetical protein